MSGEEDLKALISERPELILFDLMLPGIDGLEVCKQIKNNHETLTERSIDVLIVGLRKKLGSYDRYIETIRKVEYKFKNSHL